MTELTQETLARLTFVVRRGPSAAEVGPSHKPVGPLRPLLPDGTESEPKAYAMYKLVEGLVQKHGHITPVQARANLVQSVAVAA